MLFLGKHLESKTFKKCFDLCLNECVRKSFDIKKTAMKLGILADYKELKETDERFKNKTVRDVENYIKYV